MPNPPSTQSVCPTCGSDDPSYGHMVRMNADRWEPCHDPFHSPDTQTEECYEDSHAGYNSETGACLTCGKLVHGVLYGDELRRAEGMCKAPPPDPQGQVEERWTVVICKRCRQAIPGATEYACHGMHRRGKTVEVVPASRLDQAERRAEEAKADASEANHQANMMSRNLQAANALAVSYRQGLERIAAGHVHATDVIAFARSLLNPSSTSEGDA